MKTVSVVILVLLAVAILGCHQSQTAGVKKPAIVKQEVKNLASTSPPSAENELQVELIAVEDGKIIKVFAGRSGSDSYQVVTPNKPLGDWVKITGGDYDEIPRRLEIMTTNKTWYKVFLQGKPKKNLLTAITICLIGGELLTQQERKIWIDNHGKGWIKITLDPANKGYTLRISKEGK